VFPNPPTDGSTQPTPPSQDTLPPLHSRAGSGSSGIVEMFIQTGSVVCHFFFVFLLLLGVSCGLGKRPQHPHPPPPPAQSLPTDTCVGLVRSFTTIRFDGSQIFILLVRLGCVYTSQLVCLLFDFHVDWRSIYVELVGPCTMWHPNQNDST